MSENRIPEDRVPLPANSSSSLREPMREAESATLSPVKRALQEIRELRSRLKVAEEEAAFRQSPIAIVGMGMRFPGGIRDAGSLWDFLASGKDAITEIPRDRWDWRPYFDSNPEAIGSQYAVRGGFLEEIDMFDADFFGIAPREAAMLDPQQRLLHEVAWHALEDAGISPGELRDKASGLPSRMKTGIFLGLSNVDYYRAAFADDLRIDAYAGSGNSPSMAAGRLAYTLGVHGPAMTVDTSCSSSLVAVHLAIQSLRSGESDLALAGGVNVILGPQMHIAFSRAHMLAPDGRCKTFDAAADGYVRSEGCGIVVLKRLSDAVKNGDRVLAVIRGSAVNHDGRSGGLTAPSSRAQAALLREALQDSGVGIDSVGMIEAHGTGTSLGDPIEMEALGEVFRNRSSQAGHISVGSVKTNLGHTEAASGIAGLMKIVVALKHRTIPLHLNFQRPSPFIPWSDLPVSIPTETAQWKLNEGQTSRVGGVSSFGFSGSNAHVVLEEATYLNSELDGETNDHGTVPQVAMVSARTPSALKLAMADLAECLKANTDYRLGDICGTLSSGRAHFLFRAAWAVASREELLHHLTATDDISFDTTINAAGTPSICFLFTGQGSEQTGMGVELYASCSVFAQAIDTLENALGSTLGISIPTIWANSNQELDRASLVQPALFAFGWALSEVWRSWGVEPQVVLGHSLGEYVAATVAGVMTPEEAIRLVAARGRLTETLGKPGGMIAISASREYVDELLSKHSLLSLAANNGPGSLVISGTAGPLQELETQLLASGVRHRRLKTTHGFHSDALDGILDAFEAEAAKVNYQVPEVRWVSNLTGLVVNRDRPVDARYWRRHLRETVEFSRGLVTAQEALSSDASAIYLEIGAQPHLLALASGYGISADRGIASMRKAGSQGEWFKVLSAAAQLYRCGVSFDWPAIQDARSFRSVSLPGYPFERKRYWFDDGLKAPMSLPRIMGEALAEQSTQIPIGLDVARIGQRNAAVNRWAKGLMLSTLNQLGCMRVDSSQPVAAISAVALVDRYGVIPGHLRLLDRWLQWLSQDQILIPSGDPARREFFLNSEVSIPDSMELWDEVEPLMSGDAPQRDYLVNCAGMLLAVLQGRLSPLETLFPRGDESLAKRLYEDSPAAVYLNRMVAAVISARVRRRATTPMGYGRRVRILEVGAGTGATTASILRQLTPEEVLYTFSDVSEVFLSRARQRFHSHSMDFVLFDLDREEDSIAAAGRYDVVVIANALHVAKDLRAALARIFRVLQPGGSLVLLETTTEFVWSDVSIGMIEGWQHFEDEVRSNSPLLSVDRWISELEHAGFVHTIAAPSEELPTSALGLHVLVAHSPAVSRHEAGLNLDNLTASSLRTIRARTSENWSEPGNEPQLPSSVTEEIHAVNLREEIALAPIGERFEMVLEITRNTVAHVLGSSDLPAKDARLMDLGMDSLMAMELRNTLQKSFGIAELSTTLMFDYPSAEAIAVLMLHELGFKADGKLVSDLSSASTEEPTKPSLPFDRDANLSMSANSEPDLESDLDSMSDDEIAELLRARLGA